MAVTPTRIRRDLGVAGVKARAQHGEADIGKPVQEEGFGIGQRAAERRIDCLLHQATRGLVAVADGEEGGAAERFVDVSERYPREVAGYDSPSTMSFQRLDISPLSQARHGSPDNDGIGAHALGKHFGCEGFRVFRHVEQHMEHTGHSAIASHVTVYDT